MAVGRAMAALAFLLALWAGPVLSAPTQLPMGFPSHHSLPLPQEKERNAKRKKKKGTAVQNEEATFPPAAEDEEMEVSGTSGNEEEMAEETEGELRSLGFAAWLQQRQHMKPLQGCKCQCSQGVTSDTPEPHRRDSIPEHEVLVVFWMPLDCTLVTSVLDHCPPPVSVWMVIFGSPLVSDFHQHVLYMLPAYQGLACLNALVNRISWCFPPKKGLFALSRVR